MLLLVGGNDKSFFMYHIDFHIFSAAGAALTRSCSISSLVVLCLGCMPLFLHVVNCVTWKICFPLYYLMLFFLTSSSANFFLSLRRAMIEQWGFLMRVFVWWEDEILVSDMEGWRKLKQEKGRRKVFCFPWSDGWSDLLFAFFLVNQL